MQIIEKVSEIQEKIELLKKQGKTVGFVPTMGALHKGHLSLVNQSAKLCDITVVSIFVNPTQFNDSKDFEKYPRTLEADAGLLITSTNCDILFHPSVKEMYENQSLQVESIDIGYLDTILEGERRPGHYQGVVTIVEKLFKCVSPDKVFMGLKDYQQVKVVEKLVKDRGMSIEVMGCQTEREANGLAMSSRNTRLSEKGREEAACIYQALSFVVNRACVDKSPQALLKEATSFLHPIEMIEYLEIRHAGDLSPIDMNDWNQSHKYVVVFAGWIEGVRLIDNLEFSIT